MKDRLFTTLILKPFTGISKANCKRRSFDWKASWTSFDDIKCNKTKVSQDHDLSFNKSRRKRECELSNDGTHINLPFFVWNYS
jgi:hypothetical protein